MANPCWRKEAVTHVDASLRLSSAPITSHEWRADSEGSEGLSNMFHTNVILTILLPLYALSNAITDRHRLSRRYSAVLP